MNNTTDRWPPGFAPAQCAVHARNEIVTAQRGTAARLLAPAMRRGLRRQHQRWLEALVETAGRRSM